MQNQQSLPVLDTVLSQDILWILLWCSTPFPVEIIVGYINTFMFKMQLCEYPIEFRAQVLKSALNTYDKIKEQNDKSIKI